jgi:phosphoribosylanthranilate isomerase
MSFLTQVKLGHVTNLSDARYAAAVGINYIGFCFDPSNENYIAPIKAKEMIDWVTGSYIVGEFGKQSIQEINDISELLGVDAIEVNNQILPDELAAIGKPIIKKINVDDFNIEQIKTELQAYHQFCDAFHLYSGTNQLPLSNNEISSLTASYKIIWGFPLDKTTVVSLIQTIQPYAIHISGGNEEKVGIKDFDDLNDLLEQITTED